MFFNSVAARNKSVQEACSPLKIIYEKQIKLEYI